MKSTVIIAINVMYLESWALNGQKRRDPPEDWQIIQRLFGIEFKCVCHTPDEGVKHMRNTSLVPDLYVPLLIQPPALTIVQHVMYGRTTIAPGLLPKDADYGPGQRLANLIIPLHNQLKTTPHKATEHQLLEAFDSHSIETCCRSAELDLWGGRKPSGQSVGPVNERLLDRIPELIS